jgi:hypothetical protein
VVYYGLWILVQEMSLFSFLFTQKRLNYLHTVCFFNFILWSIYISMYIFVNIF